jgi:hypothetical protein
VRQLRTVQLCVYLLASLFLFSLARADEPKLVIVDNDFTGYPATLSDLRSALMFLENPSFKVLGFTVVTGNAWRDEEVAHLLLLEEIVSRCDVPVIPGAVTPLINTMQDEQAWEKRYKTYNFLSLGFFCDSPLVQLGVLAEFFGAVLPQIIELARGESPAPVSGRGAGGVHPRFATETEKVL